MLDEDLSVLRDVAIEVMERKGGVTDGASSCIHRTSHLNEHAVLMPRRRLRAGSQRLCM